MEQEEELTLLKDYMEYFINLRYSKEYYSIRKKDWERDGKKGPGPRLDVRNEKELEPLSFRDWIDFYDKTKN
jgi:hypothetical protein